MSGVSCAWLTLDHCDSSARDPGGHPNPVSWPGERSCDSSPGGWGGGGEAIIPGLREEPDIGVPGEFHKPPQLRGKALGGMGAPLALPARCLPWK